MVVTVTVTVTQNDIDRARRICSVKCPIAIAINKILSKNYYALVSRSILSIMERGNKFSYSDIHRITLPGIAKNFIAIHDAPDNKNKQNSKPCSFEVAIDIKYLRDEAKDYEDKL